MSRVRSDGARIGRDVDAVLERPETRLLLDVVQIDPDKIRGWVCYAEGPSLPVIHYVHVKKEHRRKGIATKLLQLAGVTIDAVSIYTQQSRDSHKLVTAFPMGAHMPLPEFMRSIK